MKKTLMIIVILLSILGILCIFASNPIISVKTDIPESYLDAIKSQAIGVYSRVLPLVPVYVSVDQVTGSTVYYTIYYFPFGAVGMSYTEADGFNIETPLTRS